ncbi:MAG: ABC transporter ATP-binding protein/permease [Phycisphaerales bacterium]|nr:ABC transporter ATP-binding protein [Planctomycetota bacterium]MCH8509213.1 ABC transporter ATP-binding protein/permease [Phycisphaerales bacterium]
MRRAARSSRTRFRGYLQARKARRSEERVHERLDETLEQKRASRAKRSFRGLFIAFWSLLAGHRLTVILSLATLSMAVWLGLLMPLSTKIALDYIITDHPGPAGLPARVQEAIGPFEPVRADRVRLMWYLAGGMLVVTTSSILFGIWGRWQCTRITKRVQVSLRRRVFEHASRLPLHRIHAMKAGGISSILREDAGNVGELIFSLIYNPWRAITQLTGTLLVLLWIDWRLLVGAVALAPLIWGTHKTWIKRIRPLYRDIRERRQGIDAMSTESFGGMRVVRSFNRRHAEAVRFTGEGHLLARQELHTWWWARSVEIVWELIIPLASIGVLLYGGTAVIDGRLTIGDLMAFTAYLLALLGPLEALVSSATNVQTNLAALDRVLDLFSEQREFEKAKPTRTIDPAAVEGRITLEGVAYAYPKRIEGGARPGAVGIDERGDPVLSGIDLDIQPGETIALVGMSGAGKTTLCNLIARFDDPTQGRILLDGIDLRELPVEQYRALLGVVEQEVFLFDGSVAENIGYARRNAGMDEVLAAAKAANAHGFITELEEGYDTLIGERGVRLSGGQKQRLAIARAILADPKILILDEATSSLDSESERLIQRSLGRLMKGRTSFVIAHRLSTIRFATRIVVIEHGAIREVGTHDELLARDGRYAELLKIQLEGSDTGSDEIQGTRR